MKYSEAIKTTIFSILGNTLMATIKWIAGILGNSHALIADAIESTTDIFASVMVLFGIRYANKPPDKNHPFGHGRIEPLVTFFVVLFLFVSATLIIIQSISNLKNPSKLPETFTLYVLGCIIVFKELSYRYVIKKSKQTNSSALKADAWHHRSDAITSISAFIGVSIALIFGPKFRQADDWAALFAAGFIIYNCYKIIRPAFGEIMDESLYHELESNIRLISHKVAGVIDTEKCFIRKTGMTYHVDLHVIVGAEISVKDGHNIARDVKYTIMYEIPAIANVLVHIEPD